MPRKPGRLTLYEYRPGITQRTQARRRQKKRALPTYSRTWRALREVVLNREPLCRHCKQAGRLTPATDVDHIDNDSHNNCLSNLQPLCHSCHSKKTYAEQRVRGGGVQSL